MFEMETQIEEYLDFIKETKGTVVYGNEVIKNLYIPKELIETPKGFPETIKIDVSWQKYSP